MRPSEMPGELLISSWVMGALIIYQAYVYKLNGLLLHQVFRLQYIHLYPFIIFISYKTIWITMMFLYAFFSRM